jgi:hypothetical protein
MVELLWMMRRDIEPLIVVYYKLRPDSSCLCCRDSGWLLPVCTDSCSTDTVANRSSTWPRLIALLGRMKPSTRDGARTRSRTVYTYLQGTIPFEGLRKTARKLGRDNTFLEINVYKSRASILKLKEHSYSYTTVCSTLKGNTTSVRNSDAMHGGIM